MPRMPLNANDDVLPKDDPYPPSPNHTSYHMFWVHNRCLKTGIKVLSDGSRTETVMFAPSIETLSNQPTAAYLATMEVMFFQHVVDVIHPNPLKLHEVKQTLPFFVSIHNTIYPLLCPFTQIASNFLQDAFLHDTLEWKAQTRASMDALASEELIVDAPSFWDTFLSGSKRVNNEVLTITDVDVNEVYTSVKKVWMVVFFLVRPSYPLINIPFLADIH